MLNTNNNNSHKNNTNTNNIHNNNNSSNNNLNNNNPNIGLSVYDTPAKYLSQRNDTIYE
jgi:hypothetical protein